MRKRKMDFVLYEDEFYRIVFRFYPRLSHCHSFDEEPPKTYKDIYKVYFNYAIICQYLVDGKFESSEQIWNSDCDECSIIDEIAYICSKISDNIFTETKTIYNGEEHTFKYLDQFFCPGDGIDWKINNVERYNHWNKNGEILKEPEIYHNFEFLMRKRNGVSYIFELSTTDTRKFGEFLQSCCDYMLEHGEPC